MASTGGIEIITAASHLIKTVCKPGGCIYARRREGYAEKEAPWDCSVLYEDHVVENINGDGCQSAAIRNPDQNLREFGTLIPGTMLSVFTTPGVNQIRHLWMSQRLRS